jgi:hypothetical protein
MLHSVYTVDDDCTQSPYVRMYNASHVSTISGSKLTQLNSSISASSVYTPTHRWAMVDDQPIDCFQPLKYPDGVSAEIPVGSDIGLGTGTRFNTRVTGSEPVSEVFVEDSNLLCHAVLYTVCELRGCIERIN